MSADALPTTRRDFVTHLGLGGVALAASACARAVTPATTAAPVAPTAQQPAVSAPAAVPAAPRTPPVPLPPTSGDGPWDMSWLEHTAKAKHALVFDVGAYQNGGGLYYAKNYVNGMRDGWGASAPQVMPILGISGDAYPIVFNDAIWAKYGYGASSKTTDPRTGEPAVRNVWWQPKPAEPMGEFGVDVLQGRGAQFLLCNNVFRGVIRRAMNQTNGSYAETRAELLVGMLPGVIVVPAMVAAMAMAQSAGASYVVAGV